jgi:hypothetical protein
MHRLRKVARMMLSPGRMDSQEGHKFVAATPLAGAARDAAACG